MRLSYAETSTPSVDAPRPCDTGIRKRGFTLVLIFPSYASRTFSIKMFHHGIKSKPPYVRPHVCGKGRSERLFFSKLDPACIRESRSHPREREREIACIYTRNIARYFSLLWMDIGEGKREEGGRDGDLKIVEEKRETWNTTERPSSKQVCFRINICSIHDGTPL